MSLGSTVTAYIPHGDWTTTTTGIGVVNIEGTAGSTTISTPNTVNACSSNSITGETVCTADNTDVYPDHWHDPEQHADERRQYFR